MFMFAFAVLGLSLIIGPFVVFWGVIRNPGRSLRTVGLFWLVVIPLGWPLLAIYFSLRMADDLRRIADALEGSPRIADAAPAAAPVRRAFPRVATSNSVVPSAFGRY